MKFTPFPPAPGIFAPSIVEREQAVFAAKLVAEIEWRRHLTSATPARARSQSVRLALVAVHLAPGVIVRGDRARRGWLVVDRRRVAENDVDLRVSRLPLRSKRLVLELRGRLAQQRDGFHRQVQRQAHANPILPFFQGVRAQPFERVRDRQPAPPHLQSATPYLGEVLLVLMGIKFCRPRLPRVPRGPARDVRDAARRI